MSSISSRIVFIQRSPDMGNSFRVAFGAIQVNKFRINLFSISFAHIGKVDLLDILTFWLLIRIRFMSKKPS